MPDTDKGLDEIIEEEANALGLQADPSVSLFGQPLKLLKGEPDAADLAIFLLIRGFYSVKPIIDTPTHVRGYLEGDLQLQRVTPEQSIKELWDGPYYAQFREPATNLFYTFAPDPALLVVITGKASSTFLSSARDYAFAVDIYTNEPSIPRGIARHLNSLYEGGIVGYTDWYKVEDLFDVLPADCIKTWCRLLDIDVPASKMHIKANPGKCTYCNQMFNDASQIYCASCGMRRR
jgi:hypothetical protein